MTAEDFKPAQALADYRLALRLYRGDREGLRWIPALHRAWRLVYWDTTSGDMPDHCSDLTSPGPTEAGDFEGLARALDQSYSAYRSCAGIASLKPSELAQAEEALRRLPAELAARFPKVAAGQKRRLVATSLAAFIIIALGGVLLWDVGRRLKDFRQRPQAAATKAEPSLPGSSSRGLRGKALASGTTVLNAEGFAEGVFFVGRILPGPQPRARLVLNAWASACPAPTGDVDPSKHFPVLEVSVGEEVLLLKPDSPEPRSYPVGIFAVEGPVSVTVAMKSDYFQEGVCDRNAGLTAAELEWVP